MAIWVEGAGYPDAICGTAPRGSDPANPTAGLTATERAWRDFVLNVQRHDCFDPKCKVKNGERIEYCKYLYPRPLCDPVGGYQLSAETNRYEYRTLQAEDQWLSPYVPLWLLATGASMNMQCVRPVWYDWMLPSKHGTLYFYQRLLLKTPWRDSTPESFIESYTTNPLGSLRRECELRGVLEVGDDGLREAVTGDATRRRFSPESVEAMLAQEDMLDAVQPMLDAMTADALGGPGDGGGGAHGGLGADGGADGGGGCGNGQAGDDTEEAGVDAARLRNEISNARYEQPPGPAPRLEESLSECYEGTVVPIVTWHEPGVPRPHVLKQAQYEAYTLLQPPPSTTRVAALTTSTRAHARPSTIASCGSAAPTPSFGTQRSSSGRSTSRQSRSSSTHADPASSTRRSRPSQPPQPCKRSTPRWQRRSPTT